MRLNASELLQRRTRIFREGEVLIFIMKVNFTDKQIFLNFETKKQREKYNIFEIFLADYRFHYNCQLWKMFGEQPRLLVDISLELSLIESLSIS